MKVSRRLRPTSPTSAKIYSESREGKAIQHEVSIDLKNGEVKCTCEHFAHRLSKRNPSIHDHSTWCRHITKLAKFMVRKGL